MTRIHWMAGPPPPTVLSLPPTAQESSSRIERVATVTPSILKTIDVTERSIR